MTTVATPNLSNNGTPGRRSPETIAQAIKLARAKLKPLAARYNIHVTSILRWQDRSAVRIVVQELKPVAAQFGVHPRTLIKWANGEI